MDLPGVCPRSMAPGGSPDFTVLRDPTQSVLALLRLLSELRSMLRSSCETTRTGKAVGGSLRSTVFMGSAIRSRLPGCFPGVSII